MKIDIQGGSWCKKFSDFVTRDVVDKCLKAKKPDFKGCLGSGCKQLTYVSKLTYVTSAEV